MTLFAIAAVVSSPFAFKSYALGTSLDAFRKETLPPDKYGPKFVQCSDKSDDVYLRPSPREGRVGVILCSFRQIIGNSEVGAEVPLDQEHSASAIFEFYEGKLFRIEVFADIGCFDLVSESLKAKYDKPTIDQPGTFQTQSGSVFPKRVLGWTSSGQSIALEAPSATTEKLLVLYSDHEIGDRLESAMRNSVDPKSVM